MESYTIKLTGGPADGVVITIPVLLYHFAIDVLPASIPPAHLATGRTVLRVATYRRAQDCPTKDLTPDENGYWRYEFVRIDEI